MFTNLFHYLGSQGWIKKEYCLCKESDFIQSLMDKPLWEEMTEI